MRPIFATMQITDTHTHLYADEFISDRDLLITEAIAKGVDRFFLPNIDSTSVDALTQLAEKYPGNCFPMMGLHPCSVKDNWKEELTLVEKLLSEKKYVAVGEIGMVFLMRDDHRTIALWNGVEAVRIENPVYCLAQDLPRCTAPYDIDDRLPEFVRKLVAIDGLFWTDIALSL